MESGQTHLKTTGAHHYILVSSVSQERGCRATVIRAELHHIDVVLTGHRVGGRATGILLHSVATLASLLHLHRDQEKGMNRETQA